MKEIIAGIINDDIDVEYYIIISFYDKRKKNIIQLIVKTQ